MITFGVVVDRFFGAVLGRLVAVAIPARGAKRQLLVRELVALDRNLQIAAELCQTVTDRLDNGMPLGIEDDGWLLEIDCQASVVSHEMIHTVRRLKSAIEVMDPTLARALEVLYLDKFSLLVIASSAINFEQTSLRVWDASEALCNLHIENLFRRLDGSEVLEFVDWPYGAVSGGLGNGEPAFDETSISLLDSDENRERVRAVSERLTVHRLALLDASRKVSEYVRAKFDLSDVI